MPIDPTMLNPMLDSFRGMMKEMDDKGLAGPAVDKMREAMQRMEQLGQEHSDIAAFSGQLMQENLYGSFSDAYSQALAGAAQAQSGGGDGGGYDDGALLRQAVDALKQAVASLRQAHQDAVQEAAKTGGGREAERLSNPEPIIAEIDKLIALGEEEGMSFPRFLRLQIERGLDRAAQGDAAVRPALQYELSYAKAQALSPHHIQEAQDKLALYDQLAEGNPIGIPQPSELRWGLDSVGRQHQPERQKWEAVTRKWSQLLDDLSHWSLSYCDFAPYIEPWSMAGSESAAREAVRRTQKTLPGIFRQREQQFRQYFGMGFHEILRHPSFQWAVENQHIGYSQAFVEFLVQQVYPHCQPFQDLPSEAVAARAQFYGSPKQGNPGSEGNPQAHHPTERVQTWYDDQFGSGRFAERFGPITPSNSQAAPWDWASFQVTRQGNA